MCVPGTEQVYDPLVLNEPPLMSRAVKAAPQSRSYTANRSVSGWNVR